MSPLLAVFAGVPWGGGGNRLWYIELELRGPAAEVRLECGNDGTTRVVGPFLAGEDRRLVLPVPVRSPLGSSALSALPLPRVALEPAAGAGSARVLGWAPVQPAAELEARASALLQRPRPPASSAPSRPELSEVLVVLVAGGFLLRLRRRLIPCALLALAAGGLAFALARARQGASSAEQVLECEVGAALALQVRSARDELALTGEWLEVSPAESPIEFVVRGTGEAGRARASACRLTSVAREAAPALDPGHNGWQPLASTWTREGSSEWRERGAWDLGQALGRGSAEPATEVLPGWLASALPPGRGVLIARTLGGSWLRCLGFNGGD